MSRVGQTITSIRQDAVTRLTAALSWATTVQDTRGKRPWDETELPGVNVETIDTDSDLQTGGWLEGPERTILVVEIIHSAGGADSAGESSTRDTRETAAIDALLGDATWRALFETVGPLRIERGFVDGGGDRQLAASKITLGVSWHVSWQYSPAPTTLTQSPYDGIVTALMAGGAAAGYTWIHWDGPAASMPRSDGYFTLEVLSANRNIEFGTVYLHLAQLAVRMHVVQDRPGMHRALLYAGTLINTVAGLQEADVVSRVIDTGDGVEIETDGDGLRLYHPFRVEWYT